MLRRAYSVAELVLGYGRAGGESQRQGKKVPRGIFLRSSLDCGHSVASPPRKGWGLYRIEKRGSSPTWVITNVGKEMDVACRDCCPLHVAPQARTGLGEGRRTEGNTLFGKNGGWKGVNRTLGRRGDAGDFEGLLRNYEQMQGLGRERGNSSWVRTTFAHLLSRARTA